jgi:hypothetical protein
MLRRSATIMLATAGVVGVLGVGIAVAADPPTCPYGNTPQVTRTQTGSQTTTQQRLRKRDGTGPRHEQRVQQRDRQGPGRHHHDSGYQGTGNPSCPFRS